MISAVHVCAQGIFAAGQLYVLASRVTDDRNLELIGLPPFDLLEDVAQAWREAGYDVDEKFKQAATGTGKWTYEPGTGAISDHIRQKRETVFQMMRRALADCLNPQPVCARVIHRLLDWISRVDEASQNGQERPPFTTVDGEEIFPEEDPLWYLTEIARRAAQEEKAEGDEDGPPSDDSQPPAADAETTDEDPLSGDESAHEGHAGSAPAPARYPEVGWRKRPRSEEPVDCETPVHCEMPAADEAEETQDVGVSQGLFDDLLQL